uniref:Vacuolar protein sorting-associated protein 13 DH-like domain-containing protein n=1 Tax=Globodera rostochiensis TaxID=31243 RepID=A0A914HUN4_GLORO
MPVEIQALYNSNCLSCGIAQSKAAEPLNIPVPCLNTPNGLLQIRPADGRHDWSKEKISWLNFNTTKRQAVRCDNSVKTGKGIFIEIVVVDEPIRRSHHRFDADSVAFTVHLFAPIHFINTLPMPVKILAPIKCELAGGEAVDIMNVVAGCSLVFAVKIGTEEYELCYTVPTVKKPLETVRLKGKSNDNAKLCLGLNWSTEFLRSNLTLYAPYWMVNETGKRLAYHGLNNRIQGKSHCCSKCLRSSNHDQCKAVEILHSPDANPLILPLNEGEFESKKKAKVKIVNNSEWSADFPLDTAGSSGRVICKSAVEAQREFEMTVDVRLCQSGLTKVVTISPFFLLQNDSKIDIEVREPNSLNWIVVPANSVIGFWPMQKEIRKTLVARYPNTEEESVQFPFTEAFEGFCQIKNNLIGLYVIVSLSDESSVIHMESFVPGMVPAILMNDTKYPIHYRQTNDSHWYQIQPNQLAPFAWSDSINDCKLEWKSGDAANSEELLRNRDISYLPSKTDGYHYCVSFLDGRQRILLFTADDKVSFIAHQAYEMEQPNMELELYLHGVGISLVNNLKSVEVLYMAISPQRPQKLMKDALPTTINTGFWCQYRQTAHMQTLHVKLQHFQVDNQLPASTFPSMLAMVPQPKSVVKNEPKPFLECSFVMTQSEHTNIVQIKLLEALVQEFAIRLDRTLINELLDIMPKERIQTGYTRDSFHKDMELTKETLGKRAIQTRVSQAKTYYQRMHISPLMIHLSFSQGHVEEGTDDVGIQWEFANLILKSVGVTLTEIQDVVFKLAFFQREGTFYSSVQLQSEIQAHYTHQFIKQLYVLVLGLDILGNPFGLVRDLRTGAVDLFYQPVLGMVTGPAEFGEGVYIGLTSAFSHTVGGVLGLASRITGTMGKGVAALTMDEDYQRRRMQARQQPTSIGEGMFRGVRGVGTGVVEGVTGVLSKPVEGVKQGGLLGGIKGIGKGIAGVIARPVSGVVDLVTTTADNVRNAISNMEDIKPIRPPRVISRDKIIRPYVFEEAVGYKIFRETERGQAGADHFLTYGAITKHLVIIVTDKHVIESRQHELTGNWSADWSPGYAELKRPLRVNTDGKFGIELRLKKEKEGFSLFSKVAGANGKLVQFSAEHVAQRVFDCILRAWESGAIE